MHLPVRVSNQEAGVRGDGEREDELKWDGDR